MISPISQVALLIIIIVAIVFLVFQFANKQKNMLAVWFIFLAACGAVWSSMIFLMSAVPQDNIRLLWILDSITSVMGAFMPPLFLMIALTFINGWKKIPKRCILIFWIPIISSIIIWTNPWHHLLYRHFSVIRSEIVFGPYIFVNGIYAYLCMMAALIVVIRFALNNAGSLYKKQVIMLAIGTLTPIIVNILSTAGVGNFTIVSTPIAFGVTMCCNIIAIYGLHIMDITPIATQHLLSRILDGYLVVNEKDLIVNFNQPLTNILGNFFSIRYNINLKDCIVDENQDNNTIIYDFISYLETCKRDWTTVSYELSFPAEVNGVYQKNYYFVEVIPLIIEEHYVGSVIILKDITQVKQTMEEIQEKNARMMEQERLAFIGQLTGGLAHNLKTPIMSISGGSVAIEKLIQECQASVGDPDVLPEDYQEIYTEMTDWIMRIRECCSYMSDIITAVKGQTTSAQGTEGSSFTIAKLMRRSMLLMQHEAKLNHCSIVMKLPDTEDYILEGDLNCLVQVMNNLVSNAIDAQKGKGGEIYLCAEECDNGLDIYVRDTGDGIAPEILERLFREMTTSKGTKGTGLGLFISNTLVRSAFGGYMWAKNNPDDGASIGMTMPHSVVKKIKLSGELT